MSGADARTPLDELSGSAPVSIAAACLSSHRWRRSRPHSAATTLHAGAGKGVPGAAVPDRTDRTSPGWTARLTNWSKSSYLRDLWYQWNMTTTSPSAGVRVRHLSL